MPRDPIRVTWRDRRPQDAGRRPGREDPSLPYGTTPQTNIPDSSATARRHARAWARNEPESTTWAGESWPRHRDPSQGPNGCRYRTGTGRRAREGTVSPTVPGSSPVALRAYLGLWAYLSSVLVMSRPFLISFNSFVFICLFFFNLRPFCCSSVLLLGLGPIIGELRRVSGPRFLQDPGSCLLTNRVGGQTQDNRSRVCAQFVRVFAERSLRVGVDLQFP